MIVRIPRVIRLSLEGGAGDYFHPNLERTELPPTSAIRLNIVEVEVLFGTVVHPKLRSLCPVCLMAQMTLGEGKA